MSNQSSASAHPQTSLNNDLDHNGGFISLQAACEIAGLGETTLRRAIKDGRLKAYRVGGRILRIKPADLEAFLTAVPVVPTTEGARA